MVCLLEIFDHPCGRASLGRERNIRERPTTSFSEISMRKFDIQPAETSLCCPLNVASEVCLSMVDIYQWRCVTYELFEMECKASPIGLCEVDIGSFVLFILHNV